MDEDHAQAAEIPVLRAKRAVGDRDIFDQFWAERLQRAQVALPMALRSLVLLDPVKHHLQTAVDPAVIQVEPESPNLERLAAALMLPRVDPGVELLQHLIVPREER